MPRLSKKNYWHCHKQLRWVWLNHSYLFSYLDPSKQWLLHDFFKPARDLTKEELLAHRQAITKHRPSLPHKAGWALKDLDLIIRSALEAQQTVLATKGKRKKTDNIRVRSLVRPEIDHDKLARALVRIAKQMHDGDTNKSP